jgi:hypothetical protein
VALPNAIAARLGEIWTLLSSWGVRSYLGGGEVFTLTWIWIAVLLPLAVLAPNTQQIMAHAEPALTLYKGDPTHELRLLPRLAGQQLWRPTPAWAVAAGVVGALGVLSLTRISEFLYFQF